MAIKILLLLILAVTFIIYWAIPRSRFAGRLKMNEPLFYLIHIIGIISGFLGIVVTVIFPDEIMTNHLYELILLPVFFVYVYSAILMRIKKGEDILDEKQNRDMLYAISISWIVCFISMFFIYALFKSNGIQGYIWFPLFVFLNIFVFSSSTLVLFKRN